jgi:hypothetical protein
MRGGSGRRRCRSSGALAASWTGILASTAIDLRIVRKLDDEKISFCLIGAAALAANGFARYTADVDLLTVEAKVLVAAFWKDFQRQPELRRGDAADPLRGVVRWSNEVPLDLIVGRGHAARWAVATAVALPSFPCPVATPLALTLLKLEAGSPQDRADILSLVSVQREVNRAAWLEEVRGHLKRLSAGARAAWKALQADLATL